MRSIIKIAIGGVLAVCTTAPAFAAKQIVDNTELQGISARATNQVSISGSSFLNELMNNTHGSIQVANFQWNDSHVADASNHKGANDQSGAFSQVQQNVTSTLNAIVWGASAQVSTVNTASVQGDQVNQAWATMFLGGF